MNEATLTQLKIIVERAVRPVQASFGRKRKMREELLAHVSEVFEEEAELGDERAALERTAQRFGNPTELTEQLQTTVPSHDAIDRWFSGEPGEATVLAASRLAAFMLALGVTVYLAATFLSGLITEWPTEAIVFTVLSILLLPVYMYSLTFATEWVRIARFETTRRPRLKTALLLFGWFVFSVTLFQGMTWLSGTASADYTDRIWLTLWLAATIPWIPWALARVADARIRCHREWASLQIE